MKIPEFIQIYCKDIIDDVSANGDFIASDDYSYDEYVEDEFGKLEKAIFVGENPILVKDILFLCEKDFIHKYSKQDELNARNNYLKSFIILYGEDVLKKTRLRVEEFKRNAKTVENLSASDLLEGWL